MTQRYIAKTGNYDYCFVGIQKVQKPLQLKDQLWLLTSMKLESLWKSRSELGVTDPVSGNIVSKVGYHD